MGKARAHFICCRKAAVIRIAYLCFYGAFAALGEALVARPALIWIHSQGPFHTALAWEVPCGALLAVAAAALALLTLWLASSAALDRTPKLPLHVAFLLLVGLCLSLRSACGDPIPPPDPAPPLLDALRAAANQLDQSYAGFYAPDASGLGSALARVRPPPFRRLGRQLPLRARILSSALSAQLTPLPGDQPGTIYIAIAPDGRSAWLTAVTLTGILRLTSGNPAIAEAHSGTHSAPGTDPALPSYPRQSRK
jgi:hypothetical protein